MSCNVLFITLDQLRADCLFGGLAAHVPTPNLDKFAATATSFLNHHTVTNPCGPARASLLTGQYAHHHGAIRNGAPLSAKHTNLALEARKLGYEPLLFGYTDSQPDPAERAPNDPDLMIYEGVMPGFREMVEMRLEHGFEWPAYLRAQGYPIDVPLDMDQVFRPQTGALGGPALYAAADSDTAYLTDETIKALDIRRGRSSWLSHVTYIRPHPPLVAPAPYHELIDPASLPAPLARSNAPNHPFVDAWFSEPSNKGLFHGFDGDHEKLDPATTQLLRATYLGLVAEADHHIGRLLDWLESTGEVEETLVVITADHGEMLGDYGMWGKAAIFEQAFHVPLMIRLPGSHRCGRITALTESVDIAPTILEWLGGTIPESFDGHSLIPFLVGETPQNGRQSAFMEIEFGNPISPNRFDRLSAGLRAEIRLDGHGRQVNFEGKLPNLSL